LIRKINLPKIIKKNQKNKDYWTKIAYPKLELKTKIDKKNQITKRKKMKRGKGGFYLSLINLIIYNNSCEKTCTQLILSFTMERRKP
jgi:hypothetical protein